MDFYHSKPKVITLCRNVYCRLCDGTGIDFGCNNNNNTNNSNNCNNSSNHISHSRAGITALNYRNARNVDGKYGPPCLECKGIGYKREYKKFELYLTGLKHGDVIRFHKEGDHWSPAMPAGDVILTLNQTPHKSFQRRNNHLFFKKTISLKTALGGSRNGIFLQHIDGRVLRVEIVAGQVIKPFEVKCIKNEGMPYEINYTNNNSNSSGSSCSCSNSNSNGANQQQTCHYDGNYVEMQCNLSHMLKGHLFIQFNIEFPKQLSPQLWQVT